MKRESHLQSFKRSHPSQHGDYSKLNDADVEKH
jgi:hypothetical protein